MAPVQKAAAPVREIPSLPVLCIEPKPGKPRSWRTPAIGALALASLAGLAYWFSGRSAAPAGLPALVTFSIHPPAGFALEGGASRQTLALSPDGSKLAFTAMDTSGAFSLFLLAGCLLGSGLLMRLRADAALHSVGTVLVVVGIVVLGVAALVLAIGIFGRY